MLGLLRTMRVIYLALEQDNTPVLSCSLRTWRQVLGPEERRTGMTIIIIQGVLREDSLPVMDTVAYFGT
jgi:hypothetical protein